MAVKQSSTALDISSEGSPVMPSVRVLYQPKPLQQNRATAEMESAHQLVEELAGPLFQMQAVADGEAHQDGQHHGRHAGCLDDGIDADGDGTEPEQGGQVIFQPAIKPVIDLSIGLCFARLHIFAHFLHTGGKAVFFLALSALLEFSLSRTARWAGILLLLGGALHGGTIKGRLQRSSWIRSYLHHLANSSSVHLT